MPRLFFGLEIPSAQSTQLSFMQSGVPNMRWVDPADFHITLCFIGDVSPRAADDMLEAVSQKSYMAPQITFTQLAVFGSKKPSSLYVGVGRTAELETMHASLARLMQRLGLQPDTRRFTPHITLGRCRNVKPAALAQFLGRSGPLGLASFQAQRLVLYSAKESTGGGPYRVESAWPLLDTVETATPSSYIDADTSTHTNAATSTNRAGHS
ncbi:MAG: RNA 2',3'-cyclic phosphodiesterase [Pseudomonadota bacterium]